MVHYGIYKRESMCPDFTEENIIAPQKYISLNINNAINHDMNSFFINLDR